MLDGHADILGLRGHLAERESHRVGAVGVDDVEGVYAVT